MRTLLPLAFLFALGCTTNVRAADFGSLAACASVKAMPKSSRIVEGCNKGAAMQDCTFSLTQEKHIFHYVVENGVLVNKIYRFERGGTAPFGIKKSDTLPRVKRKIAALTGGAEQLTDEAGDYVQSVELPCRANIYRLYVFFKNGKVDEIVASSLPPI